jgi:hypothetical protein
MIFKYLRDGLLLTGSDLMKITKYLIGSLLFFLILIISIDKNQVFAEEPIMITASDAMDKVIFDGKWTFYSEWKESSLNTISYNDGTFINLRSAHQGNYIYLMIDEVSKTSFTKNGDLAIICFAKYDNKSKIADHGYCFGNAFDEKNGFTINDASHLEPSNFYRGNNYDGFLGISSVSDKNDRYSEIPHVSYEFRIPTKVVGRYDIYNFYMGVYDTHSNKTYSWPQNLTSQGSFKIPTHGKWGQIISPDKSLPEFSLPIFTLMISMISLIYFSRKNLF